jgi:hypothetical protein
MDKIARRTRCSVYWRVGAVRLRNLRQEGQSLSLNGGHVRRAERFDRDCFYLFNVKVRYCIFERHKFEHVGVGAVLDVAGSRVEVDARILGAVANEQGVLI